MKSKFSTRLKDQLRDPIWQAIGVFVAFTTLIATLILSNLFFRPRASLPNRLMFSSDTAKDLTDFPEPVRKRVQVFVDGKEERGLRLFIVRVEYRGDVPIRPSDFETPIIGRIPDNRKVVAVQKSPALEGPLRYDREKETIEHDPHPAVSFEVGVLDPHTFQIKPLLMNPGEWMGVEIYTSAADPNTYVSPKDSTEKYAELSSEIDWSCHVANVECPGQVDLHRDYEYAGFDQPSFLEINVMHQGWSVYFIVLFTIVNLVVLVLLGRGAGFQKISSWLQLFFFALAIAFSISSAEIMADWLLPYRVFGMKVFDGQPSIAWIIFWSNILIMVLLLVLAMVKKKKPKRRKRLQDQQPDLANGST